MYIHQYGIFYLFMGIISNTINNKREPSYAVYVTYLRCPNHKSVQGNLLQ